MSLHEAVSQRCLVGKRRRNAAPQFTALGWGPSSWTEENEGLVLNPGYDRLWGNSADSVYLPSILFLRKEELEELGYFLILKVAPACYIRKLYRKLSGRLGDPQVTSHPKACL